MKKLILGAVIGLALGAVGMFFLLPRPTPAVCPENSQLAVGKPSEKTAAGKVQKDERPKAPRNVHLSEDMSDWNKQDEGKKAYDKLP